jgi:hypothetical protein
VPQRSVLFHTMYNLYINDTPQTIGINLALFVNDTSLYATERKEGSIHRILQRVLNSIATWCRHRNIKINEEKTRAVYISHWIRPPESLLTLNGQNIPFVNSVKYLGVIFDKKITWILHFFFFMKNPVYLQSVRIHSANGR